MHKYEILVPVIETDIVVVKADNLDEAYEKAQNGDSYVVETARDTFVDYEGMEILAIDGEEV